MLALICRSLKSLCSSEHTWSRLVSLLPYACVSVSWTCAHVYVSNYRGLPPGIGTQHEFLGEEGTLSFQGMGTSSLA